MKLNKLERHTAYIIMLTELEHNIANCGEPFLCNIFLDLTETYPDIQILPELFKHQPDTLHWNGGWFSTGENYKRIDILKRCIKETY